MPINLHAAAFPVTRVINGGTGVLLRTSEGYTTGQGGKRTPLYATPAAFTGTISGTTLTVTAVATGQLQPGQKIAPALTNTFIQRQLTGTPGGIGTYLLNLSQATPSQDMVSTLPIFADVQPASAGDVRQLEGMNIQGVKTVAYLIGNFNGVVRPLVKGGDLLDVATGQYAGAYLVAQSMENFPTWCKLALTLQNQN